MGNNYMNRPRQVYGGARYTARFDRYHCGCTEDVTGCGAASAAVVCPREPACDCHSPAEAAVTCVGQTVTMAYVPMQVWGDIYDVDRALCRGTLFRDLDKPFTGGRGV